MQRRLRQLAGGRFDVTPPELEFSVESIELLAQEGKNCLGSFEIINKNRIPTHGMVYSTNPRMECLTPQFEGDRSTVTYQFHSEGLSEGDILRGSFVILCSQREYSLSFCVSVGRSYPVLAGKTIRTLDDFAKAAEKDWQEAYRIFYSPKFEIILEGADEKEVLLYRAYQKAMPCSRNLEEFFVGAGKKRPTGISVETTELSFFDFDECRQEKIEIQKDGWGYTKIMVQTEGNFLFAERAQIETEDFIGSIYKLPVTVDPSAMHAGRNYGRVILKNGEKSYEVLVVAECGIRKESDRTKKRREIQRCRVRLTGLYEDYRLKRIVTGVWAAESIELLDHLHALCPKEPMFLLMKAQALIVNRQRQEAEWILDRFKRSVQDRKTPVYGYYLYLCTLMEREPVFVDKTTQSIEEIFRENADSELLLWVLSFLREEYCKSPAARLKAITYWIGKGTSSPFFYFEAYQLLEQDPYLLHRMDGTTIRILRWAARKKLIGKELAEQIFEIVPMNEGYERAVYELLIAAYEAEKKPEYIEIICSYLIKGQQFAPAFHRWYEEGITLELRITGLYEAFLLSLDEQEIVPIPRIIQMYFQYESALPYQKLAVLYRNIIAAKNTGHEVYEKYQDTMLRFALGQIEQGHIDDNLAVIYEDLVAPGFLTPELAKAFSGILFVNKLMVSNPSVVRAFIYHAEREKPQVVPVINKTAYCSIYSRQCIVVLEDAKGYRYCAPDAYLIQPLMRPDKYLDKCLFLAPKQLEYFIYALSERKKSTDWNREDARYFGRILLSNNFSRHYKNELLPEIIHYAKVHRLESFLKDFLEQTDLLAFDSKNKARLLELFLEEHMYKKAYEGLKVCGMESVKSTSKVLLAGYMIDQKGFTEQKDILLLCQSAFFADKYSEATLQYLCLFYDGPYELMIALWEKALDYQLSVKELEKRILTQMLYCGKIHDRADDIFLHYYDSGAKELLVIAYVSFRSYECFTAGKQMKAGLYDIIKEYYENGAEWNDACKLLLLKHFSEREDQSGEICEIEDALLSEYIRRGIGFSFFRKLHKSLIMKYHLYDKVFLEHRAPHNTHVVLHYSRDEDGEQFQEEEMQEVYDGIFVRSFVMFFGEMVQYYISEEDSRQIRVSESSRITNNDVYGEKDYSRYNLINQMIISNTLQENEKLYQDMKTYSRLSGIVKNSLQLL